MVGYNRWIIAGILIGLLLVGVLFAVLGGDDGEDDNPPTPTVEAVEGTATRTRAPNSTVFAFVPVTSTFTPLPVTPSATPTPSNTPTATLPFPIENYVGEWSLSLEYDFAGAPGIAGIDVWAYRALVTLRVDDSGVVLGRGDLSARVSDGECAVSVIETGDLGFFVDGELRDDDGVTILELVIDPDEPATDEIYNVSCANDPSVQQGEIEISYLWPQVTAVDLTTFIFALSDGERVLEQTAVLDDETETAVVARVELLR